MLHLITCHGRIMPRLAELLFNYTLIQEKDAFFLNHLLVIFAY